MKISYSFGIVDFLHYGHVSSLLKAKSEATFHVFGLLNDAAARQWMGTVVSSYTERKAVLEALACVDRITEQTTFDPTENLRKLHEQYPDAVIVLFHRADWKALPADGFVRSIGGKVMLTEYYKRLTPENILAMLQAESTESKTMRHSELLSTKANTLLALKPLVKRSSIEQIHVVLGKEFFGQEIVLAKMIGEQFGGRRIVVRSSSSTEDGYEHSNAGHYRSVLNVNSANTESVVTAIQRVFESYGLSEQNLVNEQVLIQSQTMQVSISGVVFTRDIKQNRPYYVINYDDTGVTDSVTGGCGGKTLWISRDQNVDDLPAPWGDLIFSIQEVEGLLNGVILDIEFAITDDERIVIFQVRPLAANYRFSRQANDEDYNALRSTEKNKYAGIPNIVGEQPVKLSDMAFWNPAEMIGSNPRCLDYSLYRELITKSAWNKGLIPMGYRSVLAELMYKVGNKPYIALDYSFMALIPAQIDESLAYKLLGYYREALGMNLTAHDKIEFEIVFNCYGFSTKERLRALEGKGFYPSEIKQLEFALFELTSTSIQNYFAVLEKDKASLNQLEKLRCQIASVRSTIRSEPRLLISRFKELLAAIEQHGTPQFARQARYAFIANELIRSLTEQAFWTDENRDQFFSSINTVARQLERDISALSEGVLSRSEFNRQYGHLRSGTYDIRQERYEKLDFIQKTSIKHTERKLNREFILSEQMQKGVEDALILAGFPVSCDQLLLFIRTALEQRECFKFQFTKALSDALELLADLAMCIGVSKDEMSYLEVQDILASEYYCTKDDIHNFFHIVIQQRRIDYCRATSLLLPDVIWDVKDFDMVRICEARPNFITDKMIEGEVCILDAGISTMDISDKIVLVEKADPGFDWIFSRKIKGLITKYGGVASHMAIRCAEFDLPAAIGCGEKIFEYIAGTQYIILDCANGRITEMH